jgi:hypothetical protein
MFDYQQSEDAELFAAEMEHLGWATITPLLLQSEEKAPNAVHELAIDLSNVYDMTSQNDAATGLA